MRGLGNAVAALVIALLLVAGGLAWAVAHGPDPVAPIVDSVMTRLQATDAPVEDPGEVSTEPTCEPVFVIDEYGLEVPISDCGGEGS